MEKKSRIRILFRVLLAIIVTPIVVILLAICLLYIPRVQRAVVEKACHAVAVRSGYEVGIGSLTLSFPLKLKATDFTMAKNGSTYLSGRSLNANISFTPLLAGKVEVNYISLDGLELNTRDMLPTMSIEGNVGYARAVARDADLANAVADIRQLFIADSNINITMADTTIVDDSAPVEWTIRLHKGRIKNCSIAIHIPHDTLSAATRIGNLRLSGGHFDIATTAIALKSLALNGTDVTYDKGERNAEEAPLDHLRFRDISLHAGNLRYAGINDISAEISGLTLQQPGGIAITRAAMRLTSINDILRLHWLEIESRNGSRINGHAIIPHKALKNPDKEKLTATLTAGISMPDLAGFLLPQHYESLHWFNDSMLNATLALSGNIEDIVIDTLALHSPGTGNLNADGYIKHLPTATEREGRIIFNGEVDDIKRFIDSPNDSIDGHTVTRGRITYDRGVMSTDIALQNAIAEISATGSYNIADTAYTAQVEVERLALADIMPDVPLHKLNMHIEAQGRGLDIFSKAMKYDVKADIDTLYFAGYRLRSINAKASQADNVSSITVEGNDNSLLFGIDATSMLKAGGISNHTTIELTKADLKAIGAVDSAMQISTTIDVAATTDFNGTHSLDVTGTGTSIATSKYRFTPADLSLNFATGPAMTEIKVENGDLNIDGQMDCGYNALFAALQKIATMNSNMMSGKSSLYHLHDYEEVLPRIALDFTCGENNMLHNFLVFKGIEAKGIEMGADISKEKGLNIKGDITKFRTAGITLDSIKFATRQNHDRLTYIIGATELSIASDDEENSQSALLYGSIKCDTITSNFILRDNIKKTDSKAGLTALIKPGNMHIHFNPEAKLFGSPYAFNRDNYIEIGKKMSVNADVSFTGDNNGFHLYTTPDERAAYNMSLDLFNIDLGEIADALPAMPDIAGNLSAQLNYRQSNDNNVFRCNANVDSLTYNGNPVGNERIALVYSPRESGAHALRCDISHNGTNVAGIRGGMLNDRFRGNISITRLPLSITQAFIDKEGVMLSGYLNGKMDFSGKLTDMKSNGYLQLDSAYAYSPMLGALLHPADDMIMIENNKVNLKEYHIYDKANTPFVINGNADITNLLNPMLSLRLNATNYEILNTPQKAGTMVYGKMYVDLRSMIRGTLDDIRMMGDLTILSKSNFAYVLPEAAIDNSKELDGLVEFVNFNDTTATVQPEQPKIDLGDITANLNLNIQEGVRMSLDFDSSRENYVSIEGDGNLNATYDNRNGFGVTGIYNLKGGQVKLSLPIIPLKTFYIQEGGRLTWTGDLFNPTLDITAYERMTVPVEMDDNTTQQVTFNAGVVVSNTVKDLAVDFMISAPENSVIQSQLNELDREALNRYAVTMIITGTYLGGRQGITASSALSSFIDAKVNQISGSTINNFDFNIGINDAMNNETGNAYTNYSFSFSKRFLNDRITVVIGGEVNSGDRPDRSAGNETFINNVSLEWRLNDSGNRYIRIFYDKNYQSLLEGEITETGIGYVYKRKLGSLKDLFTFKRKEKREQLQLEKEKTEKEEPVATPNTRAGKL